MHAGNLVRLGLASAACAAAVACVAGAGAAFVVSGYAPRDEALRRASGLRRRTSPTSGASEAEREQAARALTDLVRGGRVDLVELDVYMGTVRAGGAPGRLLAFARACRAGASDLDADGARARAIGALEAYACHLTACQLERGHVRGERDVL